MSEKVVGIVIGSRKCGTTWLYENFKQDPDLCVSHSVKESGFFARPDDLDFEYYERLYPDSGAKKVEVDSSLVYSDDSSGKIYNYNPNMRIVLVLREPIEYAVSRYSHLVRKGQSPSSDISKSVLENELLSEELDYRTMTDRFRRFADNGNLLIVPYSLLKEDQNLFYKTIKQHLIGCVDRKFEPGTEKVNVARKSKWTAITKFLSTAARAARKHRLHFVVNWAKSLGIHELLEKQSSDREAAELQDQVSSTIVKKYSTSIEIYLDVEKNFSGNQNR